MSSVFIATPIRDYSVAADFCESLGETASVLRQAGIGMQWVKFNPCPFVMFGRDILTANFLVSDATHLLFIDADIGWRAGDVLRLLRADRPIIGAVYRRKRESLEWTVGKTGADMGDYVEADRIGTGMMMIRRDALLHIIATVKPRLYNWPEPPADHKRISENLYHLFSLGESETEGLVGEDWAFCDMARKCGIMPAALKDCECTHTGEARFVGRW